MLKKAQPQKRAHIITRPLRKIMMMKRMKGRGKK